jgi:hypothetical protein
MPPHVSIDREKEAGRAETWPALPLEGWRDTYATLHMWSQIVGKSRMALASKMNHWWQVTFYVTPRGLATSPVPAGTRTFEAEFDFIDHALVVRTSDGDSRTLPLVPRTVADFYQEYRAMLRALDIRVALWPRPVEVMEAIPFAEDRVHGSYDPDAAQRCWRVLVQADRVMKQFRGRFIGKSSPVHFFWGGFDLACTRFSGRTAPRHPGGIPNCADWVMHEAYSHECISAGWWPGGGAIAEAAFYSYSYPEPERFPEARIQPPQAYYHRELRLFVLPYEAVRTAENPDEVMLEFLQSTYEAAAELAAWDRAALEHAKALPR